MRAFQATASSRVSNVTSSGAPLRRVEVEAWQGWQCSVRTVSYTHLTLPTSG